MLSWYFVVDESAVNKHGDDLSFEGYPKFGSAESARESIRAKAAWDEDGYRPLNSSLTIWKNAEGDIKHITERLYENGEWAS